MNFDINEARAIIEAAKKRGSIREAGSDLPPTSAASRKPEEPAKEIVLPEWLQNGLQAPGSDDKPSSPQWR